MTEYPLGPADLRKMLEWMLSTQVRALLRPAGFTKSGRTFRRDRGPLYDLINFQGSVHNYGNPEHCFFVNVGIGSTEIDAVYLNWPDRSDPRREHLIDRRWGDLVPDLPGELTFDADTDLAVFAAGLVADLSRVVAVIDCIDSTAALTAWAIERNWLHNAEKTCAYLSAVGDVTALRAYLHRLRDRFVEDRRWPSFNRRLVEVCGAHAPGLVGAGLLDPPAD